MSYYTPTTTKIRMAFIDEELRKSPYVREIVRETASHEFDQWLAAHDREIKAAAWDEGYYVGWDDGWDDNNRMPTGNPCRRS